MRLALTLCLAILCASVLPAAGLAQTAASGSQVGYRNGGGTVLPTAVVQSVGVDGSGNPCLIGGGTAGCAAPAATVTANTTGKATAAAPTYVEGSNNPLSLDLSGNLRSILGGTLPAFASTPTFNLGTLNGAATAALQSTLITNLGSPFQAGGSIGNTSFASTQSGTWTVQPGNTANTTPWLFTINQGGNSATVSAGGALKVDGSGANACTAVSTTALAANLVVNAAAGKLCSFEVQADSTLYASAWWIMIYNATSAPGDGAVTPLKCYPMAAGVTGYGTAFPQPITFGTGIVIGVGTNGCYTKAASTHAAFISGDYQ